MYIFVLLGNEIYGLVRNLHLEVFAVEVFADGIHKPVCLQNKV